MAFSPRGRKRVVPAIDSAILSSDMSFHQKSDSDFESPRNSERNDTDGSLQDEHPIEIAAKENKQVFYSRYLMLFVLACVKGCDVHLTDKLFLCCHLQSIRGACSSVPIHGLKLK